MKSIAGYIKKLVQTPYHLSIIGKTIKNLEGFQYETDIYLNMVYDTIQIYPRSRDTTAMVTEFKKLMYNCLPMGMCTSGGILNLKKIIPSVTLSVLINISTT